MEWVLVVLGCKIAIVGCLQPPPPPSPPTNASVYAIVVGKIGSFPSYW